MRSNFIQVVDDFYPDPDEVRRTALEMTFTARGGEKLGWGTRAFQLGGIKQRIEKRFRIGIKYWADSRADPDTENGSFFTTFSRGRRAEPVGVHYDTPPGKYQDRTDNWVMLILYMTPGAPFDAGTSMWRHLNTGLTSGPVRRDAERLKTPIRELDEILDRDCYRPRRWEEVDRVGNVYNRAVLFPSRVLHSATRHFGSNRLNGRIIQVFYFPIDTNSAS